jgi:hypothetical protein
MVEYSSAQLSQVIHMWKVAYNNKERFPHSDPDPTSSSSSSDISSSDDVQSSSPVHELSGYGDAVDSCLAQFATSLHNHWPVGFPLPSSS